MASKFSTPFMAKSPLYGAYESGAGGKVYVSNRRAFEKLQDDIVSGTKSAIAGERSEELKENFKNAWIKAERPERGTDAYNEAYISIYGQAPTKMLGECPKGKVRSKINKKCVSKKGAGKEYDK